MMLLIIRHADAGDQAEFAKTGQPDNLRPLSKKGREQMREAAKGLVELVPAIDLLVTSPYTRAVQTEEIVNAAYGGDVERETTDTLEPDADPAAFAGWLRSVGERGKRDVVAVVGHQPHLGALATWVLTGVDESRVELKKGGACLLEVNGPLRSHAAVLRWMMGPKQLRSLA